MSEIRMLVEELAEIHGTDRESLLPILQGIIKKEKYLSDYALSEVAKELNLSAAIVYGTATFYSFLEIKERGRFTIRFCKTIACDMKGQKQLIKVI